MNFSGQDQVSLYFIGIQESDEPGEVGKGGNFITEPCTCQWDSKYYKHLFIREFSLKCSSCYIFSVYPYNDAAFLDQPSSSILNFHLTPPWDSLLVLSDLLFWFSSSIFIAFPLITVLSLSETLLKVSSWQFSCYMVPKTSFFKPSLALRRGRLRQFSLFSFYLEFVTLEMTGHGVNCLEIIAGTGRTAQVQYPPTTAMKPTRELVWLLWAWGGAGLRDLISSEPRVTRWILIWKGL